MSPWVVGPTMSTPTTPTDRWTSGTARARRGTPHDPPSLVAELVLRELLESGSALTEADLHERTLLPETEVREAVTDLEARNLCATRRRGGDHEPRRYVATLPSEFES